MPSAAEIIGGNGKGMNIKGVIFDFDGTLFDSMYIWDNVGEDYLRSLGKEPEPFLGDTIKTMSMHQAALYFKDHYDLGLTVEEMICGVNKMTENCYIHDIQPKPGVIAFVNELKQAGMDVCIATATDRYLIDAALKRCGMEGMYSEIFTCSQVGHGKDEPFIYRRALEFLGTTRSNTMVFEDSYHAARTAKNDGFMVSAVFDISERRQEEMKNMCDCYITDFAHTDPFWKFASAK